MGRSHTVMAALMGADLRLVGPKHYAPPADVLKVANEIAERTGATITVTDDPVTGVEGVDFIHTDVWVSMGEPKEVWASRVDEFKAYQVNGDMMKATGNPATRFMHCLPAFHDTNTVVGREVMESTGMPDGLEVTNEVFESANSVVFQQAENRLHTIKALLVATLA
jgi:ornithine carbamoyltransferase